MARRSPIRVGSALALLCVIISHVRTDETCRTGCQGAPQTFKYQDGTTYKYNFDSKIEVTLATAEGQKSVTEVKATVLLTQQPQCNQILRLQNVQVIGSDGKKHGNIPDIDKPIRLNFQDGHLQDSICIVPGDTQNSLNVKRAIASIFQANLKNGHETDVFGLCPTEVSQHKEGNVLVVQKARNLNRCAYRENIKQDFLATAFNLNSEIKSSPLLNADYTAKLRIKNGVLEQATIHEEYLYVPFSVGNNGAKASVETSLKYTGSVKDNSQVKVSQPRSIMFEDPHPVNSPTTNVNSILAAVRQTAKTVGITVGEDTAKYFADLVKILRVSKRDDLLAVYGQVKAGVGFADKAAAKKLFLDALLRAGNGDNIEVAIELLKNRELDPIEQNLVYLGLAVVRHPTEGAVNAAAALLSQPNLPRSAYLGIGALAGRYCRQHSCKNVDAVNKLTQKLVQKLGTGKANNRLEENELVQVLKALGNIKHLNDGILAKITAIAQDKKAANRLRVTALETYQSDPCKDKLRDSALTILKDIQQDSEIRIKAYLVLAECPNTKVGNAVKALLETEPSYQVGGFIVSHIRNIRSSANPDKEVAKQHLGFINVPNRFPVDLRKWSANGEFSYSIDTLGIANSIETNVIYSQTSFLPRSTSLNLTAEVFGQSFNFLELQVRQENVDRLLEHYLGPKGLLRAKSLQELWDSKGLHAKNIVNDLKERVEKSLRARRDVTKAELDQIAKQVQIKTNDLNNDLDLDFSVKAFGSEVAFVNVNDDVRKWTPEAIVDKIVDGLNKGLDKIKHFEETLRANLLFLDAEFAYPTGAGFPLRLGVEGSSNIQIKASGAIDIPALLKRDSTLKIALIPSANVEVSGRLTIDALVVESGLKVVSTLHTATGGDLIVNLQSTSVDVKFSLPVEKQNLISASHSIVFSSREWGASEVDVPIKFAQNKDWTICLDQLSDFIGLTFCGEIAGPNLQGAKVPILPFPLSGDARVAVTIERDDLAQYHFRDVFYIQDKLGFETHLEAIAKNGQKKLSLGVEGFWYPDKYIKASLVSPVTSASVEGRLIWTEHDKSLSLSLIHDKDEYFGKLGVEVQGGPANAVYKPIVLYRTPQNSALQIPPYRVEGQVKVEHKGQSDVIYTLDNVRLVIPDQKTISINGKFGTEPETIFADLTTSDGSNTASFKGKLRINPNLVQYNAELKNSLNPQTNLQIKGEYKRPSFNEREHRLQIAHGGDFSDKNNILTVANSLNIIDKGPENYYVATKNKLSYPGAGVGLQLDLELQPKQVGYVVDVQYGSVKLGSNLEFEHESKRDGTDFRLQFGLWGLSNRLALKSERRVVGDQSEILNSLDINGKRVEVNGRVKHHIRPQDVDVGTDLTVRLPTHNAPFHVENALRLTANDIGLTHKVTSGNTVYVDIFFKGNKGGNANGAIKVTLQGQLLITGQVKANRGSGTGDITIELPSAGSTAKLDTTFTVNDPTYNILVNIYPVFNKDKSKKITLSTHSTLTPQSLDSKNTIDVFGEKLEANVKTTLQGTIDNGNINAEAELTLPNSHYLSGKLNRNLRTANNILNGDILIALEHRAVKNQPGNKFTLKGQLKDSNPQELVFDAKYQISAERANGQTLNYDLEFKKDSSSLIYNGKHHGSILASAVVTSIEAHCKDHVSSYSAKASYEPVGTVAVKGGYDVGGEGKPVKGDFNLEVTSPSQVLRTVKVGTSGSVLRGDLVSVKGEVKVYADAPDGIIADVSGDGEVTVGNKEGRIKGSIRSGKIDPVSIDTGFSNNRDKGDKQLHSDVSIRYGKNQNIKGDITLITLPQHEYKLDIKLETPAEKFRVNRLQVHSKRNDDSTHHQSDVIWTSDGKTWTSNTDLVLSQLTPSVDIKVKCPDGKLRQLSAKITKLSDHQLGGQFKLVNQEKNFLLEGTIDANVEAIENFHIKITANSPALKIDKVVIEAQNKPAKTGRRIQVTAKSGNKNILAGSTSYTAREEQGKLIIEGSGSFKVHDETKSANFKYIRQNLSQAKNGETGIEISFDAGLGNKAIDAELKVTNKQFRILNSYCEEKKQCAHVEIDIKTNADDVSQYNQEVEIAIDLRKLGLSHEFGLKAVTTRKEYVLDHTVDVHFQSQENSKYQYSLYLHPREAGVSLTTPRRIIAVEAKLDAPRSLLKDGGKISGELLLYMDKKNQPNQKSGIIAYLNVDSRGYHLEGEAKFTNPALRRPLTLSINSKVTTGEKITISTVIVADVFAQPDQKVTVNLEHYYSVVKEPRVIDVGSSFEIKSSGLAIDIRGEEYDYYAKEQAVYKSAIKLKYHVGNSRYDNAAVIEWTPRNVHALVKILNTDLYKLDSQVQTSGNSHVFTSDVFHYGHKPIVSYVEVKNWNTIKWTAAYKDAPNDKLQVILGLVPGQIADFRAELTKGGSKVDIGHATIKLDDANFLKSDYNVQAKNVEEHVFKPIKAWIAEDSKHLKLLTEEWSKDASRELGQLGELVKRATPNLSPIRQYYVDELKRITDEILADKTIKEASELLHSILVAISQATGQTFAHFSELVENVARSLQNSFGRVIESAQKELLPKLKVLSDKILHAAIDVVDFTTDAVLAVAAKALELAEKLRPELQQLATVVAEVSQDVLRAAINVYEAISTVIADQVRQIWRELKTLPAFEQLKDEYERFLENILPGPDALSNTIKDLVSTFKDIAPTEELKALVQALGDYIHLKLTNQKVDDAAAIDRIIKTALAAIRELINLINNGGEGPDLQKIQLPLPVNILNKLPRLAAVRFSALSYLLREEPTIANDFLLSLVNRPRNWIPPFPLYGLVAQGQHIFTFDGKHLTFPGKCNYLLARDAVDGNFTVAGTYTNGLLTAISLTHGTDTITLKKHGQVTVNNVASELPARRPNVAAYRNYERIVLRSEYGVKVICGPELVVCSVTVSGFYHGKLRGLLGNGNNEPYDDFVLPNGKIVTAESEFGNGYKLGTGCPAVQTVQHHTHHSNPICDKLFGWESSLSLCYPFVDVHNFKMACEHGLASGVKETEWAISIAYVAACSQHGIPIRVPPEFVKCTNGDKATALGDKFSVKTPGKSADVVLLVDTVKTNEPVYKEYVQPLVQQLTNELHSKGISDVEFHLIAYGGENQWPSHITTAGGKLTFKGKAPNLKFADDPKEEPLVTDCKITNGLAALYRTLNHDLKLAFGRDLQGRTYDEGLKYPFRANSIKSIIAVTSEPCEVGRFFPLQLLRTLLYRDKNINLNLITPVDRTGAKGADVKNVVGFNARNVFAVGATKSKVKSLSDLSKVLDYTDYCIDFTVQNDGNVFLSDHIILQAKAQRKQFIQVTSHSIVEQFVGVEKGADCECKYVTPYSASNVCKVVHTKEKALPKKTGTKS